MGDEGSSPAAAFAAAVTCGMVLDDAHTTAAATRCPYSFGILVPRKTDVGTT